MRKINREWHLEHIMPKNPSLDQKIKWHVAHVQYCHCRPVPPDILEEIKRRKINVNY